MIRENTATGFKRQTQDSPSPAGLVTVIIPVYNRARYIEQTIRSVLDQTYPHIELIVIDDGSTDESKRLIEQFLPDLTLLTHPGGVNRGQSASINLGMTHASGEYVALLDSDDFWHPDKITAQVEFLQQNPRYGLVYVNGHVVDGDGRQLYQVYPADFHHAHSAAAYLMDCFFLLPNNSLMKTAILREAGPFDETLRAAQDHDMGVRVTELTPFGYLDKNLFCYRRHADSISGSRTRLMWEDGFVILNKAKRRYPYPRKIIRNRRAVLHFRLAQCHLEAKSWHRAGWHLMLSGLLNPGRALRVLAGRERVTPPR